VRTGTRLAAFAAVLGVAAGAAAIAGAAVDPLRDDPAPAHADEAGHGHAAPQAARAPEAEDGEEPAGLAVAEGGYRLAMETAALPRGRAAELAFRIVGPDGRTVRDFDVEHERRMHLIVVRRDLTGYQHLHPRVDGSGRWSVRATLPAAGVYRAYADFSSGGRSHTLASDLPVAGAFRPAPLPAARPSDRTAGYEVELSARGIAAGADAALGYEIRRDGAPVAGIEPYLGADGHLVALREGDLAFLHVHPDEAGGPGRIAFGASFPSAGRYRLFLQFKHDGRVQTVAHTVEVSR
jgi:hypothetical protein